jgi:hypothetical protein
MISRSFAGSIASTRLEGHCERKENKIQVARFSVFIPRNTPTVTPLNVNEQDNEALKKQASQAQSVARRSADSLVADQMSTLAQAFRAQAAVLKRKRKKKK